MVVKKVAKRNKEDEDEKELMGIFSDVVRKFMAEKRTNKQIEKVTASKIVSSNIFKMAFLDFLPVGEFYVLIQFFLIFEHFVIC